MSYSIYKSLVIEYLSNKKKICKTTSEYMRRRVYVENPSLVNSLILEKYQDYSICKSRENKYTKGIYSNNLWLKCSYKKKYEKKIKKYVHDIYEIKKIYKTIEYIKNL